MQIGRLKHFVTIERLVETSDDFGQPIKSWVKLSDAWAEIRPLLGTESYNEKMIHTEHTHKIMIRYFHLDLNATMRIIYMDHGYKRVFDLHGDPSNWMERNIYWQFNVKEESFEQDDEVKTQP